MTSASVATLAGARRKADFRALISDTLAVSGLAVLARLTGAVKTIAGASYFPPGSDLVAYLLAFMVPSFMGDVLAGSIGPALIPALSAAADTPEEEQTYAEVLHRTIRWLGSLALIAALAAISAPADLGPRWRAARPMLLIMLPLVPLMGVTAIWRSMLHARLHFHAAALAPFFTPVMTIVCLPLAPRWGAMALASGTVSGMTAETIFLAIALSRHNIKRFPRWCGRTQATFRHMKRQYGALIAGSVMGRGSAAVDQAAAALLQTGALSLLNYGTRLSTVLLAIGPAAIGTTTMPRCAQAIASGRKRELCHSLIRGLAITGGLAALVVALLIWGSEPLARVAFLRGAFSAADVHQVSQVQIYSLLQLPSAAVLAILSGLAASLKVNHSMLPLWAIALALHTALDFYFLKPLGVRGIALSTTIVQGFLVCALLTLVFRLMRKSD